MFIIFEKLDLGDLINAIQINDRFSTLASDVFRRKFSYKPVRINDFFDYPHELDGIIESLGKWMDIDTIERINRNYLHINQTRNIIVKQN